jgi:hypothetical protein
MTRILTEKDVVQLLQKEVNKAGRQNDWANRTGIHRTTVNNVLLRRRAPTKSIIDALDLEVVYRLRRKTRSKRRG